MKPLAYYLLGVLSAIAIPFILVRLGFELQIEIPEPASPPISIPSVWAHPYTGGDVSITWTGDSDDWQIISAN